jgi:CheY-like chemotaxis protein
MTMPISAPLSGVLGSVKKKRVLLVDGSPSKRNLRAETMRKLGIDVDCAADITEARSWWRADLYNLVLINMENGLVPQDKFCQDMRSATPPQALAFLVGRPEYLADAPSAEQEYLGQMNDTGVARSADVSRGSVQRWGILEASQRISAVRSASNARSRALQDRPCPPRDSEVPVSKVATASRTLDELLREEMQ